MAKAKIVSEVTNGGKNAIESGLPYAVYVTVEGASDLLFHRWNCEAVDAKSKAAKNSTAKKTDDVESYIWRNSDNEICIPGEYFRQAIIHAAKFRQDPRSPRKSAMDLFKAGVVSLTGLASLGTVDWDYLDTRRVMIQRAGVNRTRPAMQLGWQVDLEFQVLTPEYIEPAVFQEVLNMAGRLVGVGDFRPTFGRFFIKNFEVSA
jgi:hypothetical protein